MRCGRIGRSGMNKVLMGLLQSIVRAIIGALNYEQVYLLVDSANQTGLDSETKRAMVLEDAKVVSLAVGNALLNLAIETAVNVLKNKS